MNWHMGFRPALKREAPAPSQTPSACDLLSAWAEVSFGDLLVPERVACLTEARSKKRALEQLGTLLLQGQPPIGPDLGFDVIYAKLLGREKIGSTGLTGGIAIPHARLEKLTAPRAAFISLQTPIDYDTLDGAPVDLLFALLVPEQANELHLRLLAQLSEAVSDSRLLDQLRATTDGAAVIALFAQLRHQDHAA